MLNIFRKISFILKRLKLNIGRFGKKDFDEMIPLLFLKEIEGIIFFIEIFFLRVKKRFFLHKNEKEKNLVSSTNRKFLKIHETKALRKKKHFFYTL